MASNVHVEALSTETGRSSSIAAAAASPGAAATGSLSPSQTSRTTRASMPGVASPSASGPLDPEEDEHDEHDELVRTSIGRTRSSPGPASLNEPQNPSIASTSSPESVVPTLSLGAELDATDSDLEPIDMETLLQILDLDEEDNHDFSRGMAWAYFDQAATTFVDMDKAFVQSSLPTLSSLGHFLKGSSAALGVYKVQHSCEQIQHYGELRDEELGVNLKEAEALEKIGKVLTRVKIEYAEAEEWLKEYYAKLDREA